MREGTDKYDDSAESGYSYAEKLALVSQGLMNPVEIGLPPGDAGQAEAIKEITGEEKTRPKLGDFVIFEASTVPNELRAHWALGDLAVKPAGNAAKDWEEKWMEEHKNEYAVQGALHSGTCHAKIGRIYADPILGFVEMMRQAADLLEAKYNDLKQKDPNPIIFRTDPRAGSSTAPASEDDKQAQE